MSLPANLPCRPASNRPRQVAPLLAPLPDAGSDLRGLLHDVGHGLFTLSLLLEQAADDIRSGRLPDGFDLLEREVALLLAVVHSGTRRGTGPARVELRSLLQPFAGVARRTTSTADSVRPGPPVVVSADPATLWRIVANLLDNARRAAGPSGTVEIVVSHSSEYTATIDVVDDGPGFR